MEHAAEVRRFCIDFALAVKSTVISCSEPFRLSYKKADGSGEVKFNGRMLSVEPQDNVAAQLAFSEIVGPADILFLEMGSGADGFALKCAKTESNVFRIPPHKVKQHMGTTGDVELDVVSALEQLSMSSPEQFYLMREQEQDIASVNALMRQFKSVQTGMRIPLQHRILGTTRQLPFLLPEDVKIRDLELALRESALEGVRKLEDFWLKRLEKACNRSEFVRSYLLPINGVGARIAGMAVGVIGDIRRFETFPKLKAYAGLSVGADNRAPRFTRGEHLTFSPALKNALYQFASYVLKANGNGKCKAHPLRFAYDDHKARYQERHPGCTPSAAHSASWRWLASELLEYIWKAWHHYLSGADPASWRGWKLLNEWQEKVDQMD